MSDKYILEGTKPVRCDDLTHWAKWFDTANRHVGIYEENGVKVSTVFLGIDHNFGSNAEPILFETMVFGGHLDGEMSRYHTWEEASRGHEEWVRKVNEPKN